MSHHWGYTNALISAMLFGISATLNKILLKDMNPIVVAGLIYFSAGILLALIRFLCQKIRILDMLKLSPRYLFLAAHFVL